MRISFIPESVSYASLSSHAWTWFSAILLQHCNYVFELVIMGFWIVFLKFSNQRFPLLICQYCCHNAIPVPQGKENLSDRRQKIARITCFSLLWLCLDPRPCACTRPFNNTALLNLFVLQARNFTGKGYPSPTPITCCGAPGPGWGLFLHCDIKQDSVEIPRSLGSEDLPIFPDKTQADTLI